MAVEGMTAPTVETFNPNPPTNLGEAPASPNPETGTPPEPAKPSHTAAFHAAARRQQALQREREALKAEKAAIAAEKAEIARLKAEPDGKPKNAIEALQRHGFTYKDATEILLNGGDLTAEQIAQNAIKEVEALREERRSEKELAEQEAIKAQEAAAAEILQDFQREIHQFVLDKKDDYELTNLYDGQAIIYATIEEHFEKTKAILSIKEAADLVEKYFEGQVTKATGTKRFQAKQEPTKPAEPKPGQFETHIQRRSLNNGMTTSTPTLSTSPAIEDDRMKRAMAALDRR